MLKLGGARYTAHGIRYLNLFVFLLCICIRSFAIMEILLLAACALALKAYYIQSRLKSLG